MARGKLTAETRFIVKPKKRCDRQAKSRTSSNKKSKNYIKPYRGQGR